MKFKVTPQSIECHAEPSLSRACRGEVRSMLYLAEDIGYIDSTSSRELRGKAVTLSKGISALTKHLRR